jgi:hypothetical protein
LSALRTNSTGVENGDALGLMMLGQAWLHTGAQACPSVAMGSGRGERRLA